MTDADLPLRDIQDAAIDSIRRAATQEGAEATEALRETAEAFVSARAHFFSADGSPDWRGRTHAYRAWVSETMGLAGVKPEERSSIQAAIRYHVGTVLRERLDGETLRRLGLRKATPRERSVEKRAKISQTLSFFTGGPAVNELDEMLNLARLISSALARVDEEALAAMPTEDRRKVREALAPIEEAVARHLKAAGARRRK